MQRKKNFIKEGKRLLILLSIHPEKMAYSKNRIQNVVIQPNASKTFNHLCTGRHRRNKYKLGIGLISLFFLYQRIIL